LWQGQILLTANPIARFFDTKTSTAQWAGPRSRMICAFYETSDPARLFVLTVSVGIVVTRERREQAGHNNGSDSISPGAFFMLE
jgi:hypothetical protein